MVDDYVDLRPGAKLAGQIAAAAVLVYSGTRIEAVGHPLGGVIELGWLSVPLTLLWLVAVTNVLNIIDGLDGLAAGMSSIAALPLLWMALQREQWEAAVLAAAALIGSTLGLPALQFQPRPGIHGRYGRMFLGFMLGAVAVEGVLGGAGDIALSIPVLVLGVPVFDTACAVIRRAASGRPIAEADDRHLHHQLIRAGLTQRQAVLLLYSVGILLALAGVALLRVSALQAFLGGGGVGGRGAFRAAPASVFWATCPGPARCRPAGGRRRSKGASKGPDKTCVFSRNSQLSGRCKLEKRVL